MALTAGCDVDGASALGGGVELVLSGRPCIDTSLTVVGTVGSCNGISIKQEFTLKFRKFFNSYSKNQLSNFYLTWRW